MWGPQSPLPRLWCVLTFWMLFAGTICAFAFSPFVLIPVLAAVGMLLYGFNAADLKMDKGKHKRRHK